MTIGAELYKDKAVAKQISVVNTERSERYLFKRRPRKTIEFT